MIINTISETLFFCASSCEKPQTCYVGANDKDFSPITKKAFYFLRHGQTDLNLERRHQGQQNTPLNETGKEQAHQAGIILAHYGIKTICSSPLLRAQETSEIVSKKVGADIHYLDHLKERYKGEAEGLLYKECSFRNSFDNITDEKPSGAESNKQFLTRTINAINQALGMAGPVLIVTHGGVLRCLSYYLKVNLTNQIERANCLPLLFEPSDKGWTVKVIS